MRFAFFGTPQIAVTILNELKEAGYTPALVVTNPDAPVGRKHILTAPPVKEWALARNIPVLQPKSLRDPQSLPELSTESFDFIVVAAYGKIIPSWLLALPKHGIINVHPSLLPKFRGASPIRSAILANERATGVTIMRMDAELDHGPIIASAEAEFSEWPLPGSILDHELATMGGKLLARTIAPYCTGELAPKDQDHTAATFCTKISKDMSELVLDPQHLPTGVQAYEYLLKVCAFDGWPETFFIYKGKRVKIKAAEIVDDTFTPTRVVPEGKSEMTFEQFLSH